MRSVCRKPRGVFPRVSSKAIVLAIVMCCSPGTLHAQTSPKSVDTTTLQDYDQLLDAAVSAFGVSDFARAHGLFKRAYELRPNARVLRGIGIAALRLSRYTEAKHELAAALSDPRQPLTEAQRDEVSKLMDWMQSSLGTLRLRITPREARVSVDDDWTTSTELTLPPGAHRVQVSLDGHRTLQRTVEIAAAREETLEIALKANEVAPVRVAELALPVAPRSPKVRLVPVSDPQTPAAPRDEPALTERWWFWTIVGAVAVGGAAAAIAIAAAPAPQKPYEKGGLGNVIVALERTP